MTKLRIYFQELLTSASTTPIFLRKEVVIEVPLSPSPMSNFIEAVHKKGYYFLELGKPTLFHNILHVEAAPSNTSTENTTSQN